MDEKQSLEEQVTRAAQSKLVLEKKLVDARLHLAALEKGVDDDLLVKGESEKMNELVTAREMVTTLSGAISRADELIQSLRFEIEDRKQRMRAAEAEERVGQLRGHFLELQKMVGANGVGGKLAVIIDQLNGLGGLENVLGQDSSIEARAMRTIHNDLLSAVQKASAEIDSLARRGR